MSNEIMTKFIFSLLFLCCFYRDSLHTASGYIKTLEKRMDELESRQEVCEKETNELKMILRNSNVTDCKRFPGINVAFSSLLTQNQHYIGIGQTIKYDKVLLNDGSGYSVHSGTFTVPATGMYLFAYIFAHYNVGQVWLELMQNGQKVNAGVTDGFHQYQDLQGANIAIIRADIGDVIWVEAYHQINATLYGSQGFTSFSGVMLY